MIIFNVRPYQNEVILNSCENNRKYELNVTLNTDLNVMLCFNETHSTFMVPLIDIYKQDIS